MRVLSVATNFGTGSMPFSGHTEGYQLGLARAAAEAGIPWTILAADPTAVEDASVLPLFDRPSRPAVAERLDEYLGRRDAPPTECVVVYEGDTELLEAFAPVAAAHPSVRFLINLFRAEPGLDMPLVRHRRAPRRRELVAFAPSGTSVRLAALASLDVPGNVTLTAETPAKSLLARSAGLPVRDVWELHSELAGAAGGPSGERARGEAAGLRVLVALRSSQLHPPVVEETIDVIESVRRAAGPGHLQWVMDGRFDDDPRVERALSRLRHAGVEVAAHQRPLSPDRYADMFRAVDVVWMPAVWPYRVQSSGKALDALVMGRPLVAPAGTSGSLAMQRWVPGMTGYGSTAEAAQLFLRLPAILPTLRATLEAQQDSITHAYSAGRTVEWLLHRLTGEPDAALDDVSALRQPPALDDRSDAPSASEQRGRTGRVAARTRGGLAAVRRSVSAVPHAWRAAGRQMRWRR